MRRSSGPRLLTRLVILGLLMRVPAPAEAQPGPPRVIVFVADGAGIGHWTIARITLERPIVDEFPVVGLVDTRGADHLVTESAASATAYATGTRTFRRALSVGPDSQPRPTVLEAARDGGLATGLVTTTYLTDATPAAFCAHYPWRNQGAVARQMAAQRVTVLLGGGRAVFERAIMEDSTTALATMRRHYTFVETAQQLRTLDLDTVNLLFGLFADRDLPLAPTRAPTLAEMTRTALTVLDRDPDGFFLLVENEETDTQAHGNRAFEVLAAEMRATDQAIREAVAYQNRHPETLIVVVGDHETGGLAVVSDSLGAPVVRYVTGGHTAALVPLFARGPGAERFAGMLANELVGRLLLAAVRS